VAGTILQESSFFECRTNRVFDCSLLREKKNNLSITVDDDLQLYASSFLVSVAPIGKCALVARAKTVGLYL